MIGVGRFIGRQVLRLAGTLRQINEHSGWVLRDFWMEDWEKQAIIGFPLKNPLEGYRRLNFVGCRHCRGESVQWLAGIGASGTTLEVEQQAIEEGHGL